MKASTNLILIFLVTALFIICCEKDNSSKKEINFSGSLTSYSSCKNNFKSTLEVNETPDTLSCVEYVFDNENNKLTLKHINAGFNCCPDTITCDIKLNGDTIQIEEHEGAALCDCNCVYDLDLEIKGVEAKKYRVKMVEPYADDQAKLDFQIDLIQNASGSYCVTRKQYPWGVYSLYD